MFEFPAERPTGGRRHHCSTPHHEMELLRNGCGRLLCLLFFLLNLAVTVAEPTPLPQQESTSLAETVKALPACAVSSHISLSRYHGSKYPLHNDPYMKADPTLSPRYSLSVLSTLWATRAAHCKMSTAYVRISSSMTTLQHVYKGHVQ